MQRSDIKKEYTVLIKYILATRSILLTTLLPSATILVRTLKSDCVKTTSDTLLAALIPLASAIPQSDSLRAKISLTPSPIYPTVSRSFKALTISCFCLGVTRPKIVFS